MAISDTSLMLTVSSSMAAAVAALDSAWLRVATLISLAATDNSLDSLASTSVLASMLRTIPASRSCIVPRVASRLPGWSLDETMRRVRSPLANPSACSAAIAGSPPICRCTLRLIVQPSVPSTAAITARNRSDFNAACLNSASTSSMYTPVASHQPQGWNTLA
ncbi:hypothetical protein GALL_216680 [mine drainage metagenome]|uniref:Uncharacterized protein n=1 Tax=mine drainage metagenome TaxID=410659 RepID=A0A1J5S7K7_9ZZZZ